MFTYVTVGQAALWALVGALVAELFQISAMMRPEPGSRRWSAPWERRADVPLFLGAVLFRLAIGVGVASAGAAAQQICDVGPAFATGIAGPLIIAKIFQILTVSSEPRDAGSTPSVVVKQDTRASRSTSDKVTDAEA